jgi:hypothetical protein
MMATAVFAVEPLLSFRNVQLGDTLTSVQKTAQNGAELAFVSAGE